MLCIARTSYDVTRSPSVRPSVRVSVCLSYAGILSKRLNIPQTFCTIGQPHWNCGTTSRWRLHDGTKMLSFSNLSDRCAHAAQTDNPVPGHASTCTPSPDACMWLDLPHRANAAQSEAGVKPRSYFFVPLTTRASAFMTRCNLSVTDFGVPANSRLQ